MRITYSTYDSQLICFCRVTERALKLERASKNHASYVPLSHVALVSVVPGSYQLFLHHMYTYMRAQKCVCFPKVNRVYEVLAGMEAAHGLYPVMMSPSTGQFSSTQARGGALLLTTAVLAIILFLSSCRRSLAHSLARSPMLHQVLPAYHVLPSILGVPRVFRTAITESATAVLSVLAVSALYCKCCEVPALLSAVPAAPKSPGIHEIDVSYVLMLKIFICCC